MDASDGVENRPEAASQFVVAPVVEALEIHFVQVYPRADVFEHLRRGVAVGYETGRQPGGLGLAENRHGPLGGDQRLVVGAHQAGRAVAQRHVDQFPWLRGLKVRGRANIAQRLGRNPVLAVSAVEVAAEHAEAQGATSRKSVEEGLLFDGIAVHRVDVTVWSVQLSSAIEADLADPRETRRNGAAMATGETLHAVAVQGAVESRLPGLTGKLFGQRFHGLSESGT